MNKQKIESAMNGLNYRSDINPKDPHINILKELATRYLAGEIVECPSEEDLQTYFEALSAVNLITCSQTMQPKDLSRNILTRLKGGNNVNL